MENGLLDFKGELVPGLVHDLHCLLIVREAELAGVVVKVLVS